MTVADRSPEELWVCHLGVVPYRDALAMQERVRAGRLAGELPDTLLLLEHPPVYTRGRRSAEDELPFGEDFYRARGIDVVATDRGGRVTYHGPGQLVGYPIMAVDDVGRYLRTIEAAIAAALAETGIEAHGRPQDGPDYTGVWVDAPDGAGERKIASIGVHISRGVATHGFAVNVHNDLDPFSWIVACGLPDVSMTSLDRELVGDRTHAPTPVPTPAAERAASFACLRKRIAHSFCQAHSRRQRLVSPRRLGIDTANAAGRAATRAPIDPSPPAPVRPSAPVRPLARAHAPAPVEAVPA
jgi:lipoyl(octanoyl) transferase